MKIALERYFGGRREVMAAALGVTAQSIWNYVSGEKDPDAKIARRLEAAVGRTFSVIETPHQQAIMAFGSWYEPGVPGYELLAGVIEALRPHLTGAAASLKQGPRRGDVE